MSVVERFKKRKVVSPTVEVEVSGVKLTIARISMMELEKASNLANKDLAESTLELEGEARSIAFLYAKMAAMALVLKPHVKAWNLEGEEFSKQSLDAFYSELNYDERCIIGFGYWSECETKDDDQKKLFQHLQQSLQEKLSKDSITISEIPALNADSAHSPLGTATTVSPDAGPLDAPILN